jgi:CRP-like cAMP-binding protein
MNMPDLKGPLWDLVHDATISAALSDRILRACSVHHVPAQTYLQHVADEPGGMWGLAEGALAVEFAPGTRDPQMGYLLLPPVWAGEGGVVTGARRMVGLSTTRKSVLLHLPAQHFASIARDEPLIWRWVSREQNKNFERALGMVDALMVRNSEARVAAVLLLLGGRLGSQANAPRVLDITQTDLAAIANLSRTVLNQALRSLASKGAIELGYSTITVADPAALRTPTE